MPAHAVHINKAIRRGHLMVNLPVLLILLGLPLTVAGLAWRLGWSPWWNIAAILPALLLAWLWWSLAAPWWRLWAYQRVCKLDLLKRMAVEARLIWRPGHWLARTEGWAFRRKLALLAYEQQQSERYLSELTLRLAGLPPLLVLEASRPRLRRRLLLGTLPVLLSWPAFLIWGRLPLLILAAVSALFFGLEWMNVLRSRNRRLQVDLRGITFISSEILFVSWDSVRRAETVRRGRQTFLRIWRQTRSPGQFEQWWLPLPDTGLSREEIETLLDVYDLGYMTHYAFGAAAGGASPAAGSSLL